MLIYTIIRNIDMLKYIWQKDDYTNEGVFDTREECLIDVYETATETYWDDYNEFKNWHEADDPETDPEILTNTEFWYYIYQVEYDPDKTADEYNLDEPIEEQFIHIETSDDARRLEQDIDELHNPKPFPEHKVLEVLAS